MSSSPINYELPASFYGQQPSMFQEQRYRLSDTFDSPPPYVVQGQQYRYASTAGNGYLGSSAAYQQPMSSGVAAYRSESMHGSNYHTSTQSTYATADSQTRAPMMSSRAYSGSYSPSDETSPGSERGSGPKERHYCQHPDCHSRKAFSRKADVDRHLRTTHNPQVHFDCPRTNCNRKGARGFTRRDHLIEHQRGYHQQPIPKHSNHSR